MPVYTVSQVTTYLKAALEGDPVLADLLVEGEVSNLKVSTAGHSYFNLKDRQGVLNCVMFRNQPGAELLREGASVSVHGRMTFYEPRGSTNFMVDFAMPEGVGELALEFERLKLRLEAEGLFDPSRKRPLPVFPQVVGVVTSPTGSVFHDIQNVIRRRYPLVELLLSPTLVQGEEAALRIAAAIERLNRDGRADLIIVARGGGSLEDLWAFNEEVVARAIYSSRIPVVSGVGHETDVTIADLVADVRAPTPSAAAELIVPDQRILRQQLDEFSFQLERWMAYQVESRRSEVNELLRRLERNLPDLDTRRRQIDDLARNIDRSLTNQLRFIRSQVAGQEQYLRALDPVSVLRRGFSVVQLAATGEVVSGTAQVNPGDRIEITVADGTIPATGGSSITPRATQKKSRNSKNGAPTDFMSRLL